MWKQFEKNVFKSSKITLKIIIESKLIGNNDIKNHEINIGKGK